MKLDLSESSNQTLYLQVYDYYKDMIINGKLPPNAKLPSIRMCAKQLQLSRTTIETAYLCLAADGYIISKPQSGYYVTELPVHRNNISSAISYSTTKKSILFDFTSSNVDRESFDFNLWRRYIKSVLRQDDRLLSYGEPQGEYELREALCNYVTAKRNAVCRPENIVIGAGSQSLLNVLCPLIKEKHRVNFHDSHFMQGIAIFEDYGFELTETETDADILYMTPSHMTKLGDVMSVTNRLALLKDAISHQRLIIEDDYNNEFRYLNRPIPCMQGLASGKHVVYISTFSKLLLPSIRLSFMILPDELLSLYEKRKNFYNQTASKSEQLALCQFLRDGHLDAQIRKLKRLYANKAKLLQQELQEVFGSHAYVTLGESVFLVHVELDYDISTSELVSRAKAAGISIFPATNKKYRAAMVLSCSEVPADKYHEACLLLKEICLKKGDSF